MKVLFNNRHDFRDELSKMESEIDGGMLRITPVWHFLSDGMGVDVFLCATATVSGQLLELYEKIATGIRSLDSERLNDAAALATKAMEAIAGEFNLEVRRGRLVEGGRHV
jgi:hypothetical protein